MKRYLDSIEAHHAAVAAHHHARAQAAATWKEWRALRESGDHDAADVKLLEHAEQAKAELTALDAENAAHVTLHIEAERRRADEVVAWKERHARLMARSDEYATKRAADAADLPVAAALPNHA